MKTALQNVHAAVCRNRSSALREGLPKRCTRLVERREPLRHRSDRRRRACVPRPLEWGRRGRVSVRRSITHGVPVVSLRSPHMWLRAAIAFMRCGIVFIRRRIEFMRTAIA